MSLPSRQDFVVSYNENHSIHLQFENDNCDGTTSPFTQTDYVCHFMIKENNSFDDDDALAHYSKPVANGAVDFELIPSEINSIGEGEKWFDIWLTNESNGNYSKPLLYGTYTIKVLTNRGE
ncbi:hypothetical protein vBVpP1_37 [Vibrio phage vB_VpP_1]|nr:hypothetical protein vBVpP1_37 [Vibrio phage vB_VpP_1]